MLGGGAGVGQAFHLVPADQVHVRADRAGQARQLLGVLDGVVEAAEQDVLQRDLAARGAEPLVARLEQLRNGAVFGPRNDLTTQLVGGGVQAERQRDRNVEAHQLLDGAGQAHGAHGDAARRDAQAPVRVQRADGAGHGLEVRQRFAHAHEHHVADALHVGQAAELPHLLHDAAAGQVALEATDAARAEAAAHRATDLAGHACGLAAVGGNHHALRLALAGAGRGVGQRQGHVAGGSGGRFARPRHQQLLRAVGRLQVPAHQRLLEAHLVRHLVAVRLRQVGHLRRIDHAAAVHPVEQLLRHECGHAAIGHPRLQRVGIQFEEGGRMLHRFAPVSSWRRWSGPRCGAGCRVPPATRAAGARCPDAPPCGGRGRCRACA